MLVGVTHDDDDDVARRMADKLVRLRVLDDDGGVMNLSVADVDAEILVVSQFTLYGDTSGGRRPSWIAAARPEQAEPLVEAVVDELRRLGASGGHRAIPRRDARRPRQRRTGHRDRRRGRRAR